MFKRTVLFILLVICSIFSFPARAQEQNTVIEYGQSVTGKITNKNFEVAFDFKAKKGDVFIIEMNAVDTLEFATPQIIVLNSDGDVQGDSTGSFGYGSAFFAGEMAKDETLTVLATRRNGRSGEGTGDFTLSLTTPTVLKVGESFQDSATSKKPKYYLINKGKTDLNLSYKKTSGDFSPEISLNVINGSFGLTSLVSLGGKYLTNVQTQVADTTGIYIVKVAEAAFDFNFKEVTVKYELQVNELKS